MINLSRLLCAGALCITVAVSPANANTIVSTFDVGNAYNSSVGWTASGSTSAEGPFVAANEFTSSGNYSVDQIDLGLGNVAGTNSATVSLWTESSGLPGVQLGSWGVNNQPAFGVANNVVATISGISGINLFSGSNYFLLVAPGASDTWDAWNVNTIGVNGLDLYSQDGGGTWTSQPDETLAPSTCWAPPQTFPNRSRCRSSARVLSVLPRCGAARRSQPNETCSVGAVRTAAIVPPFPRGTRSRFATVGGRRWARSSLADKCLLSTHRGRWPDRG